MWEERVMGSGKERARWLGRRGPVSLPTIAATPSVLLMHPSRSAYSSPTLQYILPAPPLPHRYTTSLPSNPPSIWASHVRANPSLVPLPYIFNGRWHPPQFFWPPAIPFATIIFVHQSPIRPLACVLSSRSSLCLSPAMFTHCDQYSDCRTCRFT